MNTALVAATQPPLWDGTGVDPWLPHRLAAEADISATERRLYNHWWGAFSDFLVKARRAVFANGQPDPHGVFAAAPSWAQAMTRFVQGPVKDAVGLAFTQLFGGDDRRFDQRPAVTTFLSDVHTRMVRTPDDVFGVVAGEVARGAAAGEALPTVADRIDKLLNSTTAVENWQGRAITIARTETMGALNFGRHDAFRQMDHELGGGLQQMWLATIDARTRLDHAHADGQRVPIGSPFLVGGEALEYPGDPSGSAGNVINCRCSTLLVHADEVVDMTDRGWQTYEAAPTAEESAAASPPAATTPTLPPPHPMSQFAAPYQTNLHGIEDLAKAVDGGEPRELRALTGGRTAETHLMELSDGRTVVRKIGNTDAEQAGSIIARGLGINAPRVYRDHPSYLYMDYVRAPSMAELAAATSNVDFPAFNGRMAALAHSPDGYRIGLLDHLIANSDRNPGNWLLTDANEIIPIDHGHAFGHVPRPGAPVFPMVRGEFADAYTSGRHWADNPLTPDDIDALNTRLELLRPQFELMGRADWLNYALRVVEKLAPHARGTVNLIAGRPTL